VNQLKQGEAALRLNQHMQRIPSKGDIVRYRRGSEVYHMWLDHLFVVEDMIHLKGYVTEYEEDYDGEGFSWIITSDMVDCHVNQMDKIIVRGWK